MALLRRDPGTRALDGLGECLAAIEVDLTSDDLAEIDNAVSEKGFIRVERLAPLEQLAPSLP